MRSRMTSRARVASKAFEDLTRALIAAAAKGLRPRCGDDEISYMFLSDHPGERALAATWCDGCIVWTECDQVGQHQRFGTWASRDRTVHPGKQRKDAA